MTRRGPSPGRGVLRVRDLRGPPRWVEVEDPVETIVARRLDAVVPALERIEEATAAGAVAVGFVAYEAAPAFAPELVTHRPGPLPLLWFGIYRSWHDHPGPRPMAGPPIEVTSSVDEAAYGRAMRAVKEAIERGDTYQVNLTHRLRASSRARPWEIFAGLVGRQRDSYAVYFDLGGSVLCSASPELFFSLEGSRIRMQPMKGTAVRGRWPAEDRAFRSRLAASAKERAENVMIVDMVRNDLGRISLPGSVSVPRLFEIEGHETVWQMTSTVEARTEATLPALFQALFPCASVTGAPKASTMSLIATLETDPRGIYTGALGWFGPGRRGCFSVGIRTAVVDRVSGGLEYGVGSGVVWDSKAPAEWTECQTKALVLVAPRAPFHLLETMLWRPGRGFVLLGRHLERLGASAQRWGFALPGDLRARLRALGRSQPPEDRRVRLLLGPDGALHLEATSMPADRRPRRVVLARHPVDSRDPLLYHKTSDRRRYDQALAEARVQWPSCDDVLLMNERGELTESTIANLVLRLDGRLVTPPIGSGLLPGTMRADLLAKGRAGERILSPADLDRASAIYLASSVRGLVRAKRLDVASSE